MAHHGLSHDKDVGHPAKHLSEANTVRCHWAQKILKIKIVWTCLGIKVPLEGNRPHRKTVTTGNPAMFLRNDSECSCWFGWSSSEVSVHLLAPQHDICLACVQNNACANGKNTCHVSPSVQKSENCSESKHHTWLNTVLLRLHDWNMVEIVTVMVFNKMVKEPSLESVA